MPEQTSVTFRILAEHLAAIDALAEELQVSRSEVIRRALMEGVLVLRDKVAEAYPSAG